MCAFLGIERIRTAVSELPGHEPLVLETVNDSPAEDQQKASFTVAAKGAVLIDADSGAVLFQQDAHKELPLASVTKIMTMLLVMEAVDDGKIRFAF